MADTYKQKLVQKRLLIPIGVIFLIFILGFALLVIHIEHKSQEETNKDILVRAVEKLDISLAEQTESLTSLAEIIVQDKQLRQALRTKDIPPLKLLYEDVFEKLKQEHSITHFYFHEPDRTNLLRLHNPKRHGDIINRFTAIEAERTQKASSGIELGTFGTFTLRAVLPVWEDNTLLGYLELGKEIEDILARIHKDHNIELAVTISKNSLNRKKWEEGMAMLGRSAEWSRFSQQVLIYHSQPSYPSAFDALLIHFQPGCTSSVEVKYLDKIWQGQVHPLRDVSGAEVGRLMLWHDHTEDHFYLEKLVIKVVLGALTIFFALFAYLWIVLHQTDKTIIAQHTSLADSKAELLKAHEAMEKLATTDVLTGLPNRRFAMQAMDRLWNESDINEKSVACLLIDADKFKEINDSYGHDAGDHVLREVAKHLTYAVRTDDIVCRLGGDEFLIICPNTNKDGLLRIANHIHSQIAVLTVPVSGGAWHGSISVGAAIKTPSMLGPEDLIKAADSGVYAAKNAGKNCVRML